VLAGIVLVFSAVQFPHGERFPLVALVTANLSVASTDSYVEAWLQRERHLESEQPALPIAAPAALVKAVPKRIPVSVPMPAGEIQRLIWNTFAPLGPDAQAWALRVAYCESRYRPDAVNKRSGAMGLFQFLPSTWAFTPYAKQSAFDPVANTQAALWLYKRDGPSQWSCK
jgi:soluble lytic murein transglycosylase-like protein